METKNMLNHESLRMETFRLLSDCYRLPDPQLSEKVVRLEFNLANVCEPAAAVVRKMSEVLEGHTDIEFLKIDFSKLFVGPYTLLAAPYGSVYLEGERKVMGESTLDVINRYREAGLETAKNFKDAPDHITAELEFMYYLIFKELEGFSDSDTARAVGFVQKQKYFLEDHLMAWVPEFADSIRKYGENRFYPYLAEATESFLKESHQVVCSVLDSWLPAQLRSVDINPLRA